MRGFEENLEKFSARKVSVVAISVDSPEVSREHCRKQGYSFPFLSDSKAEVIRRYGLLHRGAGAGGTDVARPAEFLVDAAGTVRWRNLTEDLRVRARAGQILAVVDRMQPQP